MTDELLSALASLPSAIDALTAKITESNGRLRQQVLATQQILAELGLAKPSVVAQNIANAAPLPTPAPREMTPEEEAVRQEQLRFLAANKAKRDAALAANRG